MLLFFSCHAQKNNNTVNTKHLLDSLQQGKDCYIVDKTINDKIDFTTINTINNTYTGEQNSYINSTIIFVNCTFTQPLTGILEEKEHHYLCSFQKEVKFINCIFQKEVNLRACKFEQGFWAEKCTFHQPFIAEGAFFAKTCTLDESIFKQDARMQGITVLSNFRADKAIFEGAAFFQDADFRAKIWFAICNFKKYADFVGATFNNKTAFNYTIFEDKANFGDSFFKHFAEFVNVKFNKETNFVNSVFLTLPTFEESEIYHKFHVYKSILADRWESVGKVKITNQGHINKTAAY